MAMATGNAGEGDGDGNGDGVGEGKVYVDGEDDGDGDNDGNCNGDGDGEGKVDNGGDGMTGPIAGDLKIAARRGRRTSMMIPGGGGPRPRLQRQECGCRRNEDDEQTNVSVVPELPTTTTA